MSGHPICEEYLCCSSNAGPTLWENEYHNHPERKERLSEVSSPNMTTTFFNRPDKEVKKDVGLI